MGSHRERGAYARRSPSLRRRCAARTLRVLVRNSDPSVNARVLGSGAHAGRRGLRRRLRLTVVNLRTTACRKHLESEGDSP